MADSTFHKMTLTAYSSAAFGDSDVLKDEDGKRLEYEVITNPEFFDWSLQPKQPESKNGKNSSSEMKFAGFEPEKYSFDLVLDGTGLVNPDRKDVAKEIKNFLRVVYSSKSNSEQANYVQIDYCGEKFNCKLSSLSIKYQLFNRDGSPLRAKLSCSFSSAQESEAKKNEKKKTTGKKKKVVKTPTESKGDEQCICVCPTYQETLQTSSESDSDSLFTPATPSK